jgi:hypothetical protein
MLSFAAVSASSTSVVRVASIRSLARARVLHASAMSDLFKDIEGFQNIRWPETFPFEDPKFFGRADESPDTLFYTEPRYVTHIECALYTRSRVAA